MLAETLSPSSLTPEQYLIDINAESAWLHKLLTMSGASDIYSDLEEYIESLYRELVDNCEGVLITRFQLSCWLSTRTKQIQQKSKELADEQDIRVDFSSVHDSRISMVFWNAGAMYSTITGKLSQELETLAMADAAIWLESLRQHIDKLAASSDEQIAVLEKDFKSNLDSCTELLETLPEQFPPQDSRPLLDAIQRSYCDRMKVVVLGFTNKIYLDILARTSDFFLGQTSDQSLSQDALFALEDWGQHG